VLGNLGNPHDADPRLFTWTALTPAFRQQNLAKPRKLDIFDLLRAVDQRNRDWLSQQSDEAQKEFASLTAMRWASGIEGSTDALRLLWLINQRVNLRLYDQEPDLSYRLLASCGLGRSFKHNWLPFHAKTATSNAAYRLLLEHHPSANDDELQLLLSLYSRSQFAELVKDCGKTDEEAKACLDAFKKLRG